jgi:hypothetical protein
MRGRRLAHVSCGLLACTALATAASARECTCGPPAADPETEIFERFEAADVVAVFEVAGSTRAPVMVGSRTYGGRWIELDTRTVFKGPRHTGTRYYATVSKLRSPCDARYDRGDLVLAYITAGKLIDLSACSVSGPVESRGHELEALARLAE